MINALMLYGSLARGDADDNSDVDLLAVSEVEYPFSRKVNGIELQFLSESTLLSSAREGSLFALHLASEGKVVFDLVGCFDRLASSIKVKNSYAAERGQAFDLAWFLHDFGDAFAAHIVNKRIAWCVRTVLISLLVEQGRVIFSPSKLASEFPSCGAPELINLRRSDASSSIRFSCLREFLSCFGAKHPIANRELSFRDYFAKTQNTVGLSTLSKLEASLNDDDDGSYL